MFPIRLTEDERAALERIHAKAGGPRKLGPWLIWHAMNGEPPHRGGITRSSPDVEVLPGPQRIATSGITSPELKERIVLDLCAGSGSWSHLYELAGYQVVKVTLPDLDVRTFVPPANVWGVLAAPPCTEFSLAKNGQLRDLVRGMECVNACVRIVAQCRPRWWALENPAGLLGKFLGTPLDVWEPCDFGDAWTKRTAVWGQFQIPTRGPFVQPTGSAMDRSTAAERAITPPGFARAFFLANP